MTTLLPLSGLPLKSVTTPFTLVVRGSTVIVALALRPAALAVRVTVCSLATVAGGV